MNRTTLRVFGALLTIGVLTGCQPSEESMAQGVVATTRPAAIRVVNLSDSALSVKVATLKAYDLETSDITPCLLVTPKKPVPVEFVTGGATSTENVQGEQGKFVTLVYKGKGDMVRFNSGSPYSIPDKAIVDCMNLTDAELTFDVGGEQIKVKPNDSVHKELALGATTVKVNGGPSEDFNLTGTEIVAVYAFKSKGKVEMKSRSLKGTGAPVATGGPSAS